MENETTPQAQPKNKLMIPAILGLVVIAVVIIVLASRFTPSSTSQPTTSDTATAESTQAQNTSPYKDGVYVATGNYVSPGGPREIEVTLTLKDGTVTDGNFVGKATDPTSQRFQGEFGDSYEAMIVGKSIDDIKLTKVSGSSLTPIGFNDAVEKIKAEAKA